jgi:hypothetical protein
MRNEKGQFVKGSSGFNGKHTEETKRKIRLARAKQGSNVWNKGTNLSSTKGTHLSLETRTKIGLAQMGNKNHNWKGGITPLRLIIRSGIKWKIWREGVFQRDSFTCKKCSQYGGKLSAHHIEDFANNTELRFEVNNGITFCKNCHIEFHKKYGNKRGNNINQLTEFLCEK